MESALESKTVTEILIDLNRCSGSISMYTETKIMKIGCYLLEHLSIFFP